MCLKLGWAEELNVKIEVNKLAVQITTRNMRCAQNDVTMLQSNYFTSGMKL